MSIHVLTLCIVALTVCSSHAAQLVDQTTTISPTHLPILREAKEHAEQTDITQSKHQASTDTKALQDSPQASERLMKELREMSKSENYKKGLFIVDLVDDNLYEWRVNLSFPDPNCLLHKDLEALKSQGKGEHVVLKMSFNANYPTEPPFVRIAYPALEGHTIHPGGIMCSQMLSIQFWKSYWSMESFIMALAGHLAEPIYTVRVSAHLDEDLATYTEDKAKESFADTVLYHEKHGGW